MIDDCHSYLSYVLCLKSVDFGEDWYKLLLSRICLVEPYFRPLFFSLEHVGENAEDTEGGRESFSKEQEFLLKNVSEILNERLSEITVPNDFALCVFGIFKNSIKVLSYATRGRSGLPTGSIDIDVLGYSLTILRDMCPRDTNRIYKGYHGCCGCSDLLWSH